ARAVTARHQLMLFRWGKDVLIEFSSAVDATRCAVDVQRGMGERNADVPPERRIELRIGIHVIRPFRRPADRERFLAGLRKVGLADQCALHMSAFGRADFKRTATLFHKIVIELGIKGFFLMQGQTAHWSYVATRTG